MLTHQQMARNKVVNNAMHSLIELKMNERTAPQCSVAHTEGDHAEHVTIVQFLKRNFPVCLVSWACWDQFFSFLSYRLCQILPSFHSKQKNYCMLGYKI